MQKIDEVKKHCRGVAKGFAAALLAAGCAWGVWAEPVARIGETDYATLDEAVAVGGEIRLLADVALDSLLVPSDANVTLDLAGHSLTGTQQDLATVVVHGRLTVDDSVGGGRITHEGAVVISKITSYASAIYNDGELSLLGGVICDCVGDEATVWNAGKFYMAGGAISNCTGTACGGVENFGDFLFAGGAIVGCCGKYGAIANNGAINNVPCTMLMTGGVISQCYSTSGSWVVYAYYNVTIQDGTFDDCGQKTLYGGWSDSLVIAGGRFAGGIGFYTSRKNCITITGGVYSQSVYESFPWDTVLPLGYECVANTDDLTAKDYPWAVEKVFTPVSPGESAEGIVAEDEAAALAAVRENITDTNAIRYDQARLIKKVAVRQPDGTWTVTLGIDTSVEGFVDPKVALEAVASQLTKVAETKPSRQTSITLPAGTLTVGLYYWIEECSEVGGEWRQIGCQMATGNALTYYLFGSDHQSRYFKVVQSLRWR